MISKKKTSKSRSAWIFDILVAASPLLVSLILVKSYLNSNLTDFVSASTDDEMHYTNETINFAHHGFNVGYSVVNEKPSPVKWIHYGVHGPGHPILYGSLLSFFPWRDYNPMILNAILIFISLLLFLRSYRPTNWKERLLIATLFSTFNPMMLFIPSALYESLHYAFAILLAAILYRLWNEPKPSRWFITWTSFLLFYFCFMRPSWVFLVPPYFLLAIGMGSKPYRLLRIGFALFAAALFGIVSIKLHNLTVAPFPGGLRWSLTSPGMMMESLSSMLGYAKWNIRNVTLLKPGNANSPNTFILLWQMIIGMLGSSGACLFLLIKFKKIQLENKTLQYWIFHTYNFWVISAAIVFAYYATGSQFYRIASIPVLLSLSLALLQKEKIAQYFVILIISMHVLTYSWFLDAYAVNSGSFTANDVAAVAEIKQATQNHIIFDGNKNPWCNTLLSALPAPYLNPGFSGLSPGIGVSVVFEWGDLQFPIKSKYVIFNNIDSYNSHYHTQLKSLPDGTFLLSYQPDGKTSLGSIHLKSIATVRPGTFYLNLDSNCAH